MRRNRGADTEGRGRRVSLLTFIATPRTLGQQFLFTLYLWYAAPAFRRGLSILPPPATTPTTALLADSSVWGEHTRTHTHTHTQRGGGGGGGGREGERASTIKEVLHTCTRIYKCTCTCIYTYTQCHPSNKKS